MLLVSEGALDSFAQFLTVLALFAIVLVITYLTTRYVAGISRTRFKGRNIQVIEAQRITSNVHVQLLKIGERYYALAVGRDGASLIGEIPADEVSDTEEQPQTLKAGFGQIFELARKKGREE